MQDLIVFGGLTFLLLFGVPLLNTLKDAFVVRFNGVVSPSGHGALPDAHAEQDNLFQDDDFDFDLNDRRRDDDPIRWENTQHHYCNIDGTPMLDDYVDCNGNPFGHISHHEI